MWMFENILSLKLPLKSIHDYFKNHFMSRKIWKIDKLYFKFKINLNKIKSIW